MFNNAKSHGRGFRMQALMLPSSSFLQADVCPMGIEVVELVVVAFMTCQSDLERRFPVSSAAPHW